MLPRSTIAVVTTLALTTFGAPKSMAQSAQKWSIQASGLAVIPSGNAYEGTSSGFGAEAQIRYTPSAFSIGLGFQASRHSLDIGDGDSENLLLSGGFLEPRYVVDIHSSKAAPYVSARLAVLTQSLTVDQYDLSSSGTQLNGGGGLLVRMTPRVNLDLGLTFGSIHFEDVKVKSGGQTLTVAGSSGNGSNVVLRVGAAVVCAAAFPRTQARLTEAGFDVVPLDVSELAKAEGAVTCCSLIMKSPES